ncbi:hypothetical protein M1P97_09145 [Parabacteroides sp. GYB001]|uniref:hypothetical protein n=1 Tax=Parabacteroides leei TaxID=2939491 RepID=UPI0020171587|nr:hypothetical protein [Parabacteroides leei]MCL3851450.1 hypothetical protein [Parabacteroides leei]
MKAKDFIIESLVKISDKIFGISLRYAYDVNTDFHIIEVSPENIRRKNDEYMEMEALLWKEFYDKYPNEDILISDIDETNNMGNMLYENSSTIFDGESYDFIKFDFNRIVDTGEIKDNCNLKLAA